MIGVGLAALALAGYVEQAAWGPARRARHAVIRHHNGMARKYRLELEGSPPHFPMWDELRSALARLSAWHERRADELRKAGRFDPDRERLGDRQTGPQPDDDEVREWLLDYHHPTNL